MFVAGIEIFFGFIAGAIILGLCCGLIVVAYHSARAVNTAINIWWERKVKEARAKNPDKTIWA